MNDSYTGRAMRMNWKQASTEMDQTLASGWRAKQTIASQAADVRDVMALIAGLAYNGYVVAAQMVIDEAQLRPSFKASPLARPLQLMVQTTTEPYEHDDELFSINNRVKAELVKLGDLGQQPLVKTALRGAALGDGIAEEASVRGICQIGVGEAARKQLRQSVEAVRLKMPQPGSANDRGTRESGEGNVRR